MGEARSFLKQQRTGGERCKEKKNIDFVFGLLQKVSEIDGWNEINTYVGSVTGTLITCH